MSERRALVTGATGFLGAHLCRELDARGWRLSGTYRDGSDTSGLADVDLDWLRADVLDPTAVERAVAGHDVVFHLAGLSLQSADAATVRRVNVEGTRHVLDACAATGVDRFVFTSTAGTRRCDGVADETDFAGSIGAYQQSKTVAESLVHDFVDDGGDAVVVHPTMAFGPGDGNFTARLVRLALDPKLPAYLPGGASIVSARDVATGTVAAAEEGGRGEHYLLAGENLTYGEALEIIADEADGYAPPLRLPAPLVHAMGPVAGRVNALFDTSIFPFNAEMARLATDRLFYTCEKATRQLGYEYRPLRDHVDEAVEWYAS
jgi:dihydroflavonol-4-reductase